MAKMREPRGYATRFAGRAENSPHGDGYAPFYRDEAPSLRSIAISRSHESRRLRRVGLIRYARGPRAMIARFCMRPMSPPPYVHHYKRDD